MNAEVTYPPANTRRVPGPRQTRRSEWPLRSAAPEVLLVPWSLRSSRGFWSSASAAGGRHQHTCNFCYLTVTRVHARIRVCVCVLPSSREGPTGVFHGDPSGLLFPLPASGTHTVSLSTRVPAIHPPLRQPAPSRPATGPLRPSATSSRGLLQHPAGGPVSAFGASQSERTAVPLARPSVGTGCVGAEPAPRLGPRHGNPGFVSGTGPLISKVPNAVLHTRKWNLKVK